MTGPKPNLPAAARPLHGQTPHGQTLHGQVIAPDKLAAAHERANAERKRIREEGHEEGKQHGLRLADRYRVTAFLAIGFAVGFVAGAALTVSIYDRGVFGATAIADRIVTRTVPDPNAALRIVEGPATRAPAEEYRANAAAAREGCTDAELRAGRRNCRPNGGRNAP